LSDLACIFRFVDAHAGTFAAIATIVIAAFTILLALSTHRLWKATKETAEAALKSAKAAEATVKTLQDSDRPYIFVRVKGGIGHITGDNFARCQCTYTLTNHGKTPALLTSVRADIWYGDAPSPFGQEAPKSYIARGGEVLNAGEDQPLLVERNTELVDAQLIYVGQKRLFCYGIIGYEDVFRVPHFTKFCWEYQHTPVKGFYASPPELNDYT